MTFWSGETLQANASQLFPSGDSPPIECAAYALSIGEDIYIPPYRKWFIRKRTRKLGIEEEFLIPPGQFAFLTTEEEVNIPYNVLGLISIKARLKWKGLVNVSGFHVDPGFKGRLIFTVFNAGPSEILLKRGRICFLLWLASLDKRSSSPFVRESPRQLGIETELIEGMAGQIVTLDSLASRVRRVEIEQRIFRFAAPMLLAVFALIMTMIVGLPIRITVTP